MQGPHSAVRAARLTAASAGMTTAAFKRLRADVFTRADGNCEGPCGGYISAETGHLDHFFGRAKAPETLENCWALCVTCDDNKTNNRPFRLGSTIGAADWCDLFYEHALKHGYHEAAERAANKIRVLVAKGLA